MRGARTHLIIPTVQPVQPQPQTDEGVKSKRDDSSPPPPLSPPPSQDQLKAKYVATLIDLVREKTAKTGDVDIDLLNRIERLLALSNEAH